jgi:hypothetical protein
MNKARSRVRAFFIAADMQQKQGGLRQACRRLCSSIIAAVVYDVISDNNVTNNNRIKNADLLLNK